MVVGADGDARVVVLASQRILSDAYGMIVRVPTEVFLS